MLQILVYVIVFYVGGLCGILVHRWLLRRTAYRGEINIFEGPEKTLFELELKGDPEDLKGLDEVVFKVNSPTGLPSQ